MKITLPTAIAKPINNIVFQAKKHSPEILTAVGVISGVAATATAVYSTMHCEEVLERRNDKIRQIEKARYVADNDPDITYTRESEESDRKLVAVQTAVDFAKLYAPTIMLTGLSVVCVLSAHNIMSKRNAATVAAFTALSEKFANYRAKVVNEYGEEADKRFYRSTEAVEIVNETTGETEVKEEPKKIDACTDRFFDELSPLWDHYNSEMNVAHLRAVIKMANDRLHIYNHVFLNEVYAMLGIPDTPAGAVMGWIIDDEHPDTEVDFGVNSMGDEDPWDFTHNEAWTGKDGIHLNFDGLDIIYDKI